MPYSLKDYLLKNLNEFLTKFFQGQHLCRQPIGFKTQDKYPFHPLCGWYSCSKWQNHSAQLVYITHSIIINHLFLSILKIVEKDSTLYCLRFFFTPHNLTLGSLHSLHIGRPNSQKLIFQDFCNFYNLSNIPNLPIVGLITLIV